jgi:hypothetical protein
VTNSITSNSDFNKDICNFNMITYTHYLLISSPCGRLAHLKFYVSKQTGNELQQKSHLWVLSTHTNPYISAVFSCTAVNSRRRNKSVTSWQKQHIRFNLLVRGKLLNFANLCRCTQVSPTKKALFSYTTCDNTFVSSKYIYAQKNALFIYYLHYDVHAVFVGEFMLQFLLFFPFLVERS